MNRGLPAGRPNRYSTLTRSGPIGAKKRAMVRAEEGWYPAWEHLLQLHRLDFWHPRVSQQSQPGWPDYVVLGQGWLAFVELKARQVTGRIGRISVAQRRYQQSIEAAGGEWRTFLLPDDWTVIDDWLCAKTGLEIRGWAQSQKASGGLVSS